MNIRVFSISALFLFTIITFKLRRRMSRPGRILSPLTVQDQWK